MKEGIKTTQRASSISILLKYYTFSIAFLSNRMHSCWKCQLQTGNQHSVRTWSSKCEVTSYLLDQMIVITSCKASTPQVALITGTLILMDTFRHNLRSGPIFSYNLNNSNTSGDLSLKPRPGIGTLTTPLLLDVWIVTFQNKLRQQIFQIKDLNSCVSKT